MYYFVAQLHWIDKVFQMLSWYDEVYEMKLKIVIITVQSMHSTKIIKLTQYNNLDDKNHLITRTICLIWQPFKFLHLYTYLHEYY